MSWTPRRTPDSVLSALTPSWPLRVAASGTLRSTMALTVAADGMRMREFRLLAFAALLLAGACGDGATEPDASDPPRPTTVTVSPATAALSALEETVQLTAEVHDQNGQSMAGSSVSWASGSAGVATVSSAGLVTAAGSGTAAITATAGGVSGIATVTVEQTLSAVTVSPAADTLVAGDTLRLTARAMDANGHAVAGAEFSWAAGDTTVAVVDATGRVTAVGAGEVGITATADGVSGRATLVSIPDPYYEELTVWVVYERADVPGDWRTGRISAARVRAGRELVFMAGRTAGTIYGHGSTWESSDTSVIALSPGTHPGRPSRPVMIARGVGPGRATVMVRTGGHSASVVVRVGPVSGTVVAERSMVDRPDDFSGPQIHFVYAVLADGRDDRRDTDGFFLLVAEQMQEWLRGEAGMNWRLDTHQGDVDVSFLSVESDSRPTFSLLRNALKEREGGTLNPNKTYAIFLDYDGSYRPLPFTGRGWAELAVTLINPHYQHVAGIAVHELIHTFGAVPECAPNHVPGAHVDDHPLDIMSKGTLVGGVLDWNNDDYFRHGRTDCLDTVHNRFWEPVQSASPGTR